MKVEIFPFLTVPADSGLYSARVRYYIRKALGLREDVDMSVLDGQSSGPCLQVSASLPRTVASLSLLCPACNPCSQLAHMADR